MKIQIVVHFSQLNWPLYIEYSSAPLFPFLFLPSTACCVVQILLIVWTYVCYAVEDCSSNEPSICILLQICRKRNERVHAAMSEWEVISAKSWCALNSYCISRCSYLGVVSEDFTKPTSTLTFEKMLSLKWRVHNQFSHSNSYPNTENMLWRKKITLKMRLFSIQISQTQLFE